MRGAGPRSRTGLGFAGHPAKKSSKKTLNNARTTKSFLRKRGLDMSTSIKDQGVRYPEDCIVFGLGQLGRLYGAGALRLGSRVTPINRNRCVDEVWRSTPGDAPILVAVGEADLSHAIESIPEQRRDHIILMQNELFLPGLESMGLNNSTVAVIWLSQKKGRLTEIARDSFVHGRHAQWFQRVHQVLDIPMVSSDEKADLELELIAKYTFILTINVLGLVDNITLGEWLKRDSALVTQIAQDAQRLGEAYSNQEVNSKAVTSIVEEAMAGLCHYPAKGRTAKQRLLKAQKDARQLNVELPGIERLKLTS
jgi:hypothetical protein